LYNLQQKLVIAMKSINAAIIVCLSAWLLLVAPHSVGAQPKEHQQLIELADLVAGTYYGDVVSDSKGSSRSDIIVTITKVDQRTVSVASDYPRLGTIKVKLTRIGNKILNASGDTTLLLDLEKKPPRLDYTPHGEVAYAGNKQE
jgi:hypothetical protein